MSVERAMTEAGSAAAASEETARSYARSEDVLGRDEAAIGDVMKIRFYPFVAARTDGVRMEDADGNSYLDFIASAGVTNTGDCHPVVEGAIRAALPPGVIWK